METLKLNLPGGGERSFLHRGTRADNIVVTQIFQAQDYNLAKLRRGQEFAAIYDAVVAAGRRPLILDAGANIGAATVYFGMLFPKAHVIALEPEAGNFALLQANSAGLDIDARCVAIGSADGEASLFDPGEGDMGYRTVAGSGGRRVPVVGAAGLVGEKLRQGCVPFIAKVDIEGGEAELFSRDTGWVERFPLLIIELHDWLMPRGRTSRNFLRCIAGLDRDFVHINENIFSIANDWTFDPNRD